MFCRTLIAAITALILTGPALAQEKNYEVVGADGGTIGNVALQSGPHGTVITLSISPGGIGAGWHGIHLHEVADCSDVGAFKNPKGHINPRGTMHGFLNPDGYHPADLPNIHATAESGVMAQIFAPGVALEDGDVTLEDDDGSAIVIHTDPDDHTTQPIGGAGARVACAEIK